MASPSSAVDPSSAWGHGYFTGASYGSFSFRELAPNWLDFAGLSQRYLPPRLAEGSPFTYLELGSGMGLGLCLLAAAYPEATFVGIDFHPGHVSHGAWLASELRLSNIQFHEADFLDMASSPSLLPFDSSMRFHYVVAHGILSWVGPAVREALFSLAASLLRPGGYFYCSYNTYPGWLERSAFKSLVDLEHQRLGVGQIGAALERANQVMTRLLQAYGEGQGHLSQALPRLAGQLQMISALKMPEYLSGEYGHEYWQPFYVGEVHRHAAAHKLSYVASASLPENHPGLLPESLALIVADESDSLIQQALLDLAINQSFRRDLFVKGPLHLTRYAQHQQLSQLKLRLISPHEVNAHSGQCGITIETSLGAIADERNRFQLIEELLLARPATLLDIHQLLGIALDDLYVLIGLLLHAGSVNLDRGVAIERASDHCDSVNRRLIGLMQNGYSLGFLSSPTCGHGAQAFSVIDAFTLDGIRQGLDDDMLATCVWMGMDAAGVQISSIEDGPLNDPQQCLAHIGQHVSQFRAKTLPRLVRLGILQPAREGG